MPLFGGISRLLARRRSVNAMSVVAPAVAAATLASQRETFVALAEELDAFLVCLRDPGDLAAARRLIALRRARHKPVPDHVEERALRLELAVAPFDLELSRSLAALLHRLDRPPLPDEPAPDAAGLPGDDIDALIAAGDAHARADDVLRQFAALWQACVRHPADPRGFAEYARVFAECHEWANCRLAVRRAFVRPGPVGPATADALLGALATLAEHGRLDDLGWQAWFERLPEALRVNPGAVRLLVACGDSRAAALVSPLIRTRPDHASTWLVAAMAAFEAGHFLESYDFLQRALAADTPATLHTVVRDWSAQLCQILEHTDKTDDLDAWLTARNAHCSGLNLVPGRPAPGALHVVRRHREVALDRGLPPFVFVAGGKTASATVSNIITSGFELPTVLHSIIYMRVIAPWLADFLRGGSSYTTHLLPSPANVDRLVAGGVKRLIVHVRDPRQILVSYMEHIRRYPREMTPARREIIRRDPRQALDVVIEAFFSWALAWIVGWAQARDRLDIRFTTFEEFVRDPGRFVDRLVALYGGDSRWFNRDAALREPTSADFHRRRGEIDEWRRRLDAEQTRRVNALIPDDLWNLFGWSP
jgi:hypothetical protein